MAETRRSVDLNALLSGANLVVLGLILYEAFRLRSNIYVSPETHLLGVLLCVQTMVALILERFNRDPFVILFAFTMIFYYGLRVFTLSLWGFSDVFPRYPYDADDTNFALFYMLIANCFIYAGLFSVRTNVAPAIMADGWKATSAGRVVFVLLAAIVFSYLGGTIWAEGLPRALSFVTLLLSPTMLLLMVLAYYILFRKSLGYVAAAAILALVLIEVVAHTLAGSRSAIIGLIQSCLLVLLAISGRVKLSRGLVVLGIAVLPIVFALIVATFAISTYNRFTRVRGEAPNVERAVEFVSASSQDALIVDRLGILAPAIASRAGFFDYSAEIIAQRDRYAAVFNGPTYVKSIIDNLLTPGMDFFDQPKIMNALQFVYENWGTTPSKTYVLESYHSDQIGIYGEFFVLFGWASLPIFFASMLLLKRLYVRLSSPNPYALAMKRIVVLFVFVRSIDSFGMDATVIEVVPLIMGLFIYSKFFTSRPIANGDLGERPPALAR